MADVATRAPDAVSNDKKILLSSFANVGLHVDKVRGFLKAERLRTKKGKNCKKKPPRRGLGVAQLEKLRLIEEHNRQETAVRLAILQGQATHVLYPVRPVSTYQYNTSSCPTIQHSEFLKAFSPKPFQDPCSASNGMRQTQGFHFAPDFSAISHAQEALDDTTIKLGLSTEMTSVRQFETSLSTPTFNVWDAEPRISSDCGTANCTIPLQKEPAGKDERAKTIYNRWRSELSCIPFYYRSEPREELPLGSKLNDHVPMMQKLCVPSPADKTGELSSFQRYMNDYILPTSMKDEMIHLERRPCPSTLALMGNIKRTVSRIDDRLLRISSQPSHVDATLRSHEIRKESLLIKKSEGVHNSPFHDFLAIGLSTHPVTAHEPDKEVLSLGFPKHFVQESNASHSRACMVAKKTADIGTVLDKKSNVENETRSMNLLAELERRDIGGSSSSSVLRLELATNHDGILISRCSSPDINDGDIDVALKL